MSYFRWSFQIHGMLGFIEWWTFHYCLVARRLSNVFLTRRFDFWSCCSPHILSAQFVSLHSWKISKFFFGLHYLTFSYFCFLMIVIHCLFILLEIVQANVSSFNSNSVLWSICMADRHLCFWWNSRVFSFKIRSIFSSIKSRQKVTLHIC